MLGSKHLKGMIWCLEYARVRESGAERERFRRLAKMLNRGAAQIERSMTLIAESRELLASLDFHGTRFR
jgi:hypothetical protein